MVKLEINIEQVFCCLVLTQSGAFIFHVNFGFAFILFDLTIQIYSLIVSLSFVKRPVYPIQALVHSVYVNSKSFCILAF